MSDATPAAAAESADTEHASERKRMRASAIVFGLATVFSRIAGMVRQIAATAVFGSGDVLAAYTVASQVPNLIRSLVADSALSAAFVPVFTDLREQGDPDRAWRLARSVCALIVLVLGPLTILAMAFSPQIVELFVSRSFAQFHLAVDLTRIMLPIVVLMSLSGVVVGILAAHDHFSAPALAPIAWNGVIIAGLIAATPFLNSRHDAYAYAIATLGGTVVQVLIPVPWLRGRGQALTGGINLRDPRLREMLLLMVPVTVSLGLINIQQLIDTKFSVLVPGRLIPHGVDLDAGPAIIDNAFRIYMLPQGIFSVAISTVIFPALARYATRGDTARFRETFSDGLRQIFLLLLPSAALLVALAEPSIRLLYQHGAFTADQTPVVADTMRAFAWGLAFNGASLLVIRALFSQKAPRVATIVSVITLLVNVGADALLYRHLGVPGIALSTSITNVAGFSALYWFLHRKVGALDTLRNLRAVALAAVASALAGGLAWVLWNGLDSVLGRNLFAQLVSVGVATMCAGALYLAIVVQLRLIRREVLVGMVRRRAPTIEEGSDE